MSRAISAKSARSAWIIPARVMRTEAASVAPSRVSTGRTIRRRFSSGLWPGSSSATGGSASSQEKNTRISSEPITNSGSEMTASEVVEIATSAGRPAWRAAMIPSSRDRGIMRSAVMPASHERRHEARADLVPDRQLGAGRVARRRVCRGRHGANPLSQSAYRTTVGLSRPIVFRSLRHLRRCRGLSEDGAGGVARAAPRCRRRRASRRRAASRAPQPRGARESARPDGCRRAAPGGAEPRGPPARPPTAEP